jgi:hydrogenase expression/formation protein HypE
MSGDRFTLSCPLPLDGASSVQMAHGGGGRLMRRLLETVFFPAFENDALAARHDGAVLDLGGARAAFTTDAYVVSPLFFPGGDIGRLAVFGTVNDLAMTGARPVGLAAAFILEEGLPLPTLARVVDSIRDAAAEARVAVVTGDTKVVDRGKGDGLYITTAGVGLVAPGVDVRPGRVRPGDAVILSGDVGRHGVAILSVREGIRFETPLESDCAPLGEPVAALLEAGVEVHCLRDLTRGGLASAANEIALDAGVSVTLDEGAISVCEPVASACELLGLDPLYVANEGRFLAFVPEPQAERAADVLARHAVTSGACVVGSVGEAPAGAVTLRSRLGGSRLLDLLSGEQLPRIC